MAKIAGYVAIILGIFWLGACVNQPQGNINFRTDLTVQKVRTVNAEIQTFDGTSWHVQGDIQHVGCSVGVGCWSEDQGEIEMIISPLVDVASSSDCPLDADSEGECGPVGIHFACNGTNCQAVQNGQPYTNRWACIAEKVEGVCKTDAVALACPVGQNAVMEGLYPFWAICKSPAQCVTNDDCTDDGDACTTETCNQGQCVSTIAVGSSCNDGNACTVTDVCAVNGSCSGTAMNCADTSTCTVDSCLNGTCQHTPTVGASCNDQNPCTEADVCNVTGACAGTAKTCNDQNVCTDDRCNPTTGVCSNAAVQDTTACNDNDLCTQASECLSGVCSGDERSCDDQNPCTLDSCDPATGQCVNEVLDDGASCGVAMVCVDAICMPEANTCSPDGSYKCRTISQELGYWHCQYPVGATLGIWHLIEDCGLYTVAVCADGAGGGCAQGPSTEVACGDGVDNDHDGQIDCGDSDCATLACSDGTVCTENDVCTSGVCVGTARSCNDSNSCTTDSCNPTLGCVNDPAPLEGLACGTGSTCHAGVCIATSPQCASNADCLTGFYCSNGTSTCYVFTDQHGRTPSLTSGANGGPLGDTTPDSYDDDGDGYCEVAPCYGSANPSLLITTLQGGDCDDNPRDDVSGQYTLGTGTLAFLTDGSYSNHPGAQEWVDQFDNNCDGTVQ